jgi:hypothetical protein
MGTLHSDLRTPFSKKVPKHLRPAKPKKAPSTTTLKNRQPTIDPEAVAAADAAIGAVGSPAFLQTAFIPDTSFLNDQDSSLLVGSGPRGAFKWFKGRRFLTDEVSCRSLNLYPLMS